MIEWNSSAPRSYSRGSKVVRGFPALASAMNETKRRRKFLLEANVVFSVAKEKMARFPYNHIHLLCIQFFVHVGCEKLEEIKVAKKFKVILTAMSLFVLTLSKDSSSTPDAKRGLNFGVPGSSSDQEELQGNEVRQWSRCRRRSCDSCCKSWSQPRSFSELQIIQEF